MQNESLTSSSDQMPNEPTALTVSELVHLHLNDQHHEITDEAIRNIDLQLDKTVPDPKVESADDIEAKQERIRRSYEEDSETQRITTPAEILGK